jgi:hypothetical protein
MMCYAEKLFEAKKSLHQWTSAIAFSVVTVLVSSQDAIEAGNYREINIFSGSVLVLSLLMAAISIVRIFRLKASKDIDSNS